MSAANGLARFRADPKKVSVSVRRFMGAWLVCVSSRGPGGAAFSTRHASPKRALAIVLRMADEARLDGIDLSMGYAYPHPWKRAS